MRRSLLAVILLLVAGRAGAQPADCRRPPPDGPRLPLSLDLAGRPGVPSGVTGQAYVQVPVDPPGGYACQERRPPPRDVLRGEPGDVLHGPPSPDLLRGPGTPRVEVEVMPR
ncbi:MAG TPA: hypothetical protein VFW75_11010 [Acetobacteraceae bacterium]|nr:hypothetical protein [Acetobacteraceae bacterium]